ncbi:MAG: hypothetical protein NC184_05510 [Roseburia sp.]|nr:hypothetical protein [Roseburia sp.]
MKVKSIQEAWAEANKIMPTDYMLDEKRTERAGYKIYYSTAEDVHAYICDLGDRLEVNTPDGKSTNIWIDNITEREMPDAKNVYKTIYTAVTIRARKKSKPEAFEWKDVAVDSDTSFTKLKARLYEKYGIDFEQQHIIDANGETVYSFAGHQETYNA